MFPRLKSVKTPAVLTRPRCASPVSVTQRWPSGPATMSSGAPAVAVRPAHNGCRRRREEEVRDECGEQATILERAYLRTEPLASSPGVASVAGRQRDHWLSIGNKLLTRGTVEILVRCHNHGKHC